MCGATDRLQGPSAPAKKATAMQWLQLTGLESVDRCMAATRCRDTIAARHRERLASTQHYSTVLCFGILWIESPMALV
jgi:hypothetical protein